MSLKTVNENELRLIRFCRPMEDVLVLHNLAIAKCRELGLNLLNAEPFEHRKDDPRVISFDLAALRDWINGQVPVPQYGSDREQAAYARQHSLLARFAVTTYLFIVGPLPTSKPKPIASPKPIIGQFFVGDEKVADLTSLSLTDDGGAVIATTEPEAKVEMLIEAAADFGGFQERSFQSLPANPEAVITDFTATEEQPAEEKSFDPAESFTEQPADAE